MANEVDGYDATFWNRSYRSLRDTIAKELDEFLFDDDVAEEAVFIDCIRRVGYLLRGVRQNEETGEYEGVISQPEAGRFYHEQEGEP